MKVAKVQHVRTAVGIKNRTAEGMIYQVPIDKEGIISGEEKLRQYVEGRNKDAQKLYTVFAEITDYPEDEDDKEVCRKLQQAFNHFANRILKCRGSLNEKIQCVLNYKAEEKINAETYFIDLMVNVLSRKSLRQKIRLPEGFEVYLPEVIGKLLKALISGEGYGKAVRQIPEKELEAFVFALEKDYHKTQMRRKIVESIKNQNVKVQVKKGESSSRLQLSSAERRAKNGKGADKANIFKFVRAYALADAEEKERLFIRFRQLILLYYYGIQKYEDAKMTAMNPWNWSGLLDHETYFQKESAELLNANKECSDKVGRKKTAGQIRLLLRDKISWCYRDSVQAAGIDDEDRFWLQFIERTAEKLLLSGNNGLCRGLNERKLKLSYLCEATWKEWLSYIAMKYVDIGKAVYHFAMPDLQNLPEGAVIGEILPEYQEGISSFDYERITAEENLERAVSSYVTFAVHSFSQAVCSAEERIGEKKEDILQIKPNNILEARESAGADGSEQLVLKADVKKSLMQFFGGISNWQKDTGRGQAFAKAMTEMQNPSEEAASFDNVAEKELTAAMMRELRMIRNSSFHYTSEIDENEAENPIVKALFLAEMEQVGNLYRKKYASNNVLQYYSKNQIEKLMYFLYSKSERYPAQIPAFEKVIGRSELNMIIPQMIGADNWNRFIKKESMEEIDKYKSAFYFLLKEIYYHGFLQDENLKSNFWNTMTHLKPEEKDKWSFLSFKTRVKKLYENPEITLGEICQQIMTDYNQQNNQIRKVRTSRVKEEERLYENYPILLAQCMQQVFLYFLKNKKTEDKKFCFRFLFKPERRDVSEQGHENAWEEETFALYHELRQTVDEDRVLLAWYTMAHFLNGKYLNHLIGDLKSYIQYVKGINMRAEITDNRIDEEVQNKIVRYERIIQMLDLCRQYNGQISAEITDYFIDEEEYAKYLRGFVDFDDPSMPSRAAALKCFCVQEEKASPSGSIGIFHNGQKTILNRNVILARMFGNEKLLSKCFQPVEEQEIRIYYRLMKELQPEFKAGGTLDPKRREKMTEFQQMKNRIELFDVMNYSEIVNDLLSNLVSWAYLRERDLMYFQLGFHYLQLFHGEKIPMDDERRVLKGKAGKKDINIKDGAMLYEIAAVYSPSLPVYAVKGEGKLKSAGGSTGAKISAFCSLYGGKGEEVYMEGLSLFEYANEHRLISDFRNYVDHFKYTALLDRSLLDLYSECYDRFFTYDTKLRKNVVDTLQNILAKNKVIAQFAFAGEEESFPGDDGVNVRRKMSKIYLRENRGMESDKYTYHVEVASTTKTKDGKEKTVQKKSKIQLPVRSSIYLEQLEKILNYRENQQ